MFCSLLISSIAILYLFSLQESKFPWFLLKSVENSLWLWFSENKIKYNTTLKKVFSVPCISCFMSFSAQLHLDLQSGPIFLSHYTYLLPKVSRNTLMSWRTRGYVSTEGICAGTFLPQTVCKR